MDAAAVETVDAQQLSNMKLRSIIFEGFEPATSIINGKSYSVDWLGSTDSIEEFIELLKRVPDSIESIKVPINLNNFSTGNDYKTMKPTGDWRSEVITIIKSAIESDNTKSIDRFHLRSFYGISHMPNKNDSDPIYIQLESKSSREFGADMASGKYGPLD